MKKKMLSVLLILAMTLSLLPITAAAAATDGASTKEAGHIAEVRKNGSSLYYTSLNTAITAATDPKGYIMLLDSASLTGNASCGVPIYVRDVDNFKLELNKHILTFTGNTGLTIYSTITLENNQVPSNKKVPTATIKDGTIKCEGNTTFAAVQVGNVSSGKGTGPANVTITDTKIESNYAGVLVRSAGSVLTVSGESNITGKGFGITTNGSDIGQTITINGGTVRGSDDACGIYLPSGELTISGDDTKISGGAGIVVRGGKLTMTGGTVTATGTGDITVGDAKKETTSERYPIPAAGISVDNASYPQNIDVTISGGNVTADNSGIKTVSYTKQGDNDEPGGQNTVSITGGTFTVGENNTPDETVGRFLDSNLKIGTNGKIEGGNLKDRVSPAILAKDENGANNYKSYEITGVTQSTEGNYLEVKLQVDGLKAHTSTDTSQSGKKYYFGVAVTAPEGATKVAAAAKKSDNLPESDFAMSAETIEAVTSDGKKGIAIYVALDKPTNSVGTYWIKIQWQDKDSNVITTDLIKLVPTIFFVPDGVTATITNVGYKTKGEDARTTINSQVDSALKPTSNYDAGTCDDDTMWAIYSATVTATTKFRVIASHNGSTIAEGPATDIASTNKGGIMYFTFKRPDHVGTNKLKEGVYTFTLQYQEGNNWVKIDDENLTIYKVQFAAVNGTIDDAAQNGGYAMAADASGIVKPKVTPEKGYKAVDTWSEDKDEKSYTITYTMTCVKDTTGTEDPDKDPDKKPDAQYTITFDPNGGTLSGSDNTATTGTDGKLSKLPTPTRSGYTFDGWYTAKTGGTKVTTSTVFTEDTTVFAHWTPNETTTTQYTITFELNGGTLSGSKTAKTDTNGRLSSLPTPTRSGYIFSGWYTANSGGDEVTTNYKFTRDTTIYAKYFLNTFTPPQAQTPSQSQAQASAQTPLPPSAFTPVVQRPAAVMWDVPTSSWAYSAAQWAYQNGYLDTTADGTFRLDDPAVNLQMWRIMAKWLGASALDDGSVSLWARQNGAARAGAASGAMTRQNMVEYLYQCYFLMGGDVSATGNLVQYRDGHQITSDSARNAWSWAVDKGIISGTPDGYLNPGKNLSRGEFATILMKMCQVR